MEELDQYNHSIHNLPQSLLKLNFQANSTIDNFGIDHLPPNLLELNIGVVPASLDYPLSLKKIGWIHPNPSIPYNNLPPITHLQIGKNN